MTDGEFYTASVGKSLSNILRTKMTTDTVTFMPLEGDLSSVYISQ